MGKILSKTLATACALAAGTVFASVASADEALQNGKIGYAMTNKNWAVYQTPDGKAECPNGLNDGPREQFDKLYPRDKKHTYIDTQLERESEVWVPEKTAETHGLPFYEPQGKIGIGLNLDGKVGPEDFTSPDGKVTGIDNQIYRAFGCVASYRGPDGSYRHFVESYMQQYKYNRFLLELTGIDSLTNDPDVTVTIYRGLDALLLDSAGNFIPGGTQRADHRWGKDYIKSAKGKIVDGVLTTTPIDIYIPETLARGAPKQFVRDWRVELRLTEDGAEGLMGGYLDIERLQNNLAQNWATHFRSYGQESIPSEYRSFIRNADAYPGEDGKNAFISSAWQIKFKQAFIVHPPAAVAAGETGKGEAATAAARQ
ncbi:MAG: hypothetical protein IT566_00540 [Rhodospirillaceae bacterium]|nr:hypothetical protein [Rhodospirillaceae bacterium]